MNDNLTDKQMDRKNFYLIKYALLINLAVTALLAVILYVLEIEKEPVIILIIKYYLN